MKAFIVYESMFGNTAKVARAVAAGLGGVQVDVVEVATAPPRPGEDVDLIVVGGPTHAFSMSRSNTRSDAVSRGATQGSADVGVREWLNQLPAGRHKQTMATFDTRVDKARRMPGSAAKSAGRVARRHGFQTTAPSQSFYVADVEGPLLQGELERARAWGAALASSFDAGSAARGRG